MGNPNRILYIFCWKNDSFVLMWFYFLGNRGLFVSDSEDDETTEDDEEDSLEASISEDDEE